MGTPNPLALYSRLQTILESLHSESASALRGLCVAAANEVSKLAASLGRCDLLHEGRLIAKQGVTGTDVSSDAIQQHVIDFTASVVAAFWERYPTAGEAMLSPSMPTASGPISSTKKRDGHAERARNAFRAAQAAIGPNVTADEAFAWAKKAGRFGRLPPSLKSFERYLRDS